MDDQEWQAMATGMLIGAAIALALIFFLGFK